MLTKKLPTLKRVTPKYVEVTHENGSMQRYTWKGLTRTARSSVGMQALLNVAEEVNRHSNA